ncbi:MAG: hypothetical protein K2F90_00910 [Clostridiales bacterium]|nr:hypothetical protein [Clostridiales bacterium]
MENNVCGKCKYFDRYYTKGIKRYDRTEFGWCSSRRNSVNANECCEHYQAVNNVRGVSRRVKVCLSDLLTELSAIRMIIEDEANDEQ